MQEHKVYEYAVIRFVPKVDREEFINIGIILYCSSFSYLEVLYCLNAQKISSLNAEIPVNDVHERLEAIAKICKGTKESGPIGKLPLSSRFRWLTSVKSTIIQTSKVHPGICKDPQSTLQKLMLQYVL